MEQGSKDKEQVTQTEIFLTRAEVLQIIDERLSSLRIYVLESDITDAQKRIKAIVEQSQF